VRGESGHAARLPCRPFLARFDPRASIARERPGLVGFLLGFRAGPHRAIRRNEPLYLVRQSSVDIERKRSMANIKSQIKRIATNRKAQERNKAVKSELKTLVRHTREAVAAGDKEKASAALAAATKKLDKAVSKGVIHANQAANRKSAIAKQVAAL